MSDAKVSLFELILCTKRFRVPKYLHKHISIVYIRFLSFTSVYHLHISGNFYISFLVTDDNIGQNQD